MTDQLISAALYLVINRVVSRLLLKTRIKGGLFQIYTKLYIRSWRLHKQRGGDWNRSYTNVCEAFPKGSPPTRTKL